MNVFKEPNSALGDMTTSLFVGDRSSGQSDKAAREDHRHDFSQDFVDRLITYCTSTTRPADPFYAQAIIETDTGKELFYYGATHGWKPNWAVPWGYQGMYASTSTAQTGIGTTFTDLTNLSMSVTLLGNRNYRLEGEIVSRKRTTTGYSTAKIVFDGTDRVERISSLCAIDAYDTLSLRIGYFPTANQASKTVKLQAKSSSGTIDVTESAAWTAFLSVEDLGPNGNPV